MKEIGKMLLFIEEGYKKILEEAKQLTEEGRDDEAKFLKAKANIYDIFKTLLLTAQKQSGDDAAAFDAAFRKLAENIPANWRKSLEVAKAHNDAEKTLMEETKLAAVDEIMLEYNK